MALANPNWERPFPTTAGISVLRLLSPWALEYTNREKPYWKRPLGEAEGKHAPVTSQNIQREAIREHVPVLWTPSKYLSSVLNPGSSLYRACCFWINPWPLFKPWTVSGCSTDRSRTALLNERFQRDPFLVTRIPNPSPERLHSAVQHGSDRVLFSFQLLSSWRRAPTPTTRQSVADHSFLRHSIFGFISYHRLSLWSKLAKHFFLA